jgi:hypothetical protein
MHSKTIFILVLSFLISPALSAQTIQLKWLLELDAEAVPTGNPDETCFHYSKKGHLYRMSVQGDVQELTYDEVTYLKGPYWQIRRGNLKGIWHRELGEIIPPVYTSISMAATKDGPCWAFAVNKYGMSAIVNEKNQIIKPWATPGYNNLLMIGDTILEYKKGYATEFMSRKGFDLKESQVRWMKAPEFKRLSADKFIYTYTKAGKVKVDTFSNAEAFSAGLAAVAVKNQWGYLAENGTLVIRPQFQSAGPFNEHGYAVVKANGVYGLIRRDGKPVFTPKFVFLKHFAQGLYEFKEGDQIGLCDTTGKIVLPAAQYSSFIPAGKQAFAAQFPNKNLKIYSISGGEIPLDSIVECKGDLNSELFMAAVLKNKKQKLYGLVDSKGTWVLPTVFTGAFQQYAHYFIANGRITQPDLLQGVMVDKVQEFQKLIYNLQGKPVLSYAVNGFMSVKDSPIAIFELNKLYGLVTPDGLLLEPIYNSIKPVGNNWFYVERGGMYGVVKGM